MLRPYVVTMKHDHGETRIQTTASSAESAVKIVCKVENAPLSAAIKVEDA